MTDTMGYIAQNQGDLDWKEDLDAHCRDYAPGATLGEADVSAEPLAVYAILSEARSQVHSDLFQRKITAESARWRMQYIRDTVVYYERSEDGYWAIPGKVLPDLESCNYP